MRSPASTENADAAGPHKQAHDSEDHAEDHLAPDEGDYATDDENHCEYPK